MFLITNNVTNDNHLNICVCACVCADAPRYASIAIVPVTEPWKNSYILTEYEEALKEGEVKVAYGRVGLIGPAAVGKTSLKHGLMNKPLPSIPESTIVADVDTVRPVSYQWARAGSSGTTYWKEVNERDEVEELAQLMASHSPRKEEIAVLWRSLSIASSECF